MRHDQGPQKAPTCDSHHDLARADQDACTRLMPAGTRDQMGFLLMRYEGNSRAVAAVLNIRRRTVERHAKGSFLPASRVLRERLREVTLDALCPVRIEVETLRAAKRGRRRARDGEG